MPKLVHSLPRYCRHPNGQAFVCLDGGRIYLGRHGREESRAQYDRLVQEWLAGGRSLLSRQPQGVSVNQLLLAFWKHAEQHYQKGGETTSELHCYKAALRYAKDLYGGVDVRDFTPLALKACRQAMIEAGLARGTINGYVYRIRHAFRWGVENELVPPTVYQALAAVAGLQAGRCQARETAPRRPVPKEQIDAVKEVVAQEVRDLVDLQLLSGARPGELLSLTTSDLNMEEKIWVARLEGHKTEHFGKERLVFFGRRAQLILRRYMKADRSAKLFNYTTNSYRRAITRVCERLGTPRWTPHWLRHTAGTTIRDEFGAEAAQTILGHSRLNTTELYARKSVRLAIEVMERVG